MVVGLTGYQQALDYLFARTTGATRLGLERTDALLDVLGNPQDSYPTVHIAGTNGKGSVAAMLESMLRASGMRVGKYTSPHLVDFRERITVDGAAVSEADVANFVMRWTPAVERIGATFFEATTAMAFDVFARAEVDIAVVETGLGGRLDSTNVIVPRCAVVTNVSMDHMDYLGNSVEEIAREKAGIFKRGVPAVIGEQNANTRDLLVEHARIAMASRIVCVADDYRTSDVRIDTTGTHFKVHSREEVSAIHTGLPGLHQVANTVTAIAAFDAMQVVRDSQRERAIRALARVNVPGRCQIAGDIIFDVAHNPAGAEVVSETLLQLFGSRSVVALICVLADKDWRSMLLALSPVVQHFILTDAPTAPESRKWDLGEVEMYARSAGLPCEVQPDFDAALALGRTAQKLLVTGSFHTVGDAMLRLQVSPLGG